VADSTRSMHNPDFVALAKAMGLEAITCDNLEDLPAKMKYFMEYRNDRPIFFEAKVVRNEHVYPVRRTSKPS
jgi:acetolactate synthase-1/2/3 large subunit